MSPSAAEGIAAPVLQNYKDVSIYKELCELTSARHQMLESLKLKGTDEESYCKKEIALYDFSKTVEIAIASAPPAVYLVPALKHERTLVAQKLNDLYTARMLVFQKLTTICFPVASSPALNLDWNGDEVLFN